MTYPIDQLRKLAEAHRSRANMTKLSVLLDDLEETNELLKPWLEKGAELGGLLDSFGDRTAELAEDVLPEGVQGKLLDAIDVVLGLIPTSTDNLTHLSEFYEAARDRLQDLDDSMEDRSYTAEDRDTMWYEAADQAGNIAIALEELENLGQDPAEEKEPEE
jgi:hypothetical protein